MWIRGLAIRFVAITSSWLGLLWELTLGGLINVQLFSTTKFSMCLKPLSGNTAAPGFKQFKYPNLETISASDVLPSNSGEIKLTMVTHHTIRGHYIHDTKPVTLYPRDIKSLALYPCHNILVPLCPRCYIRDVMTLMMMSMLMLMLTMILMVFLKGVQGRSPGEDWRVKPPVEKLKGRVRTVKKSDGVQGRSLVGVWNVKPPSWKINDVISECNVAYLYMGMLQLIFNRCICIYSCRFKDNRFNFVVDY